MKKRKQGKEIRKPIRIMAFFMALIMVSMLILPLGAGATDVTDAAGFNTSETAAEEEPGSPDTIADVEVKEGSSDAAAVVEEKEDSSDKTASSEEEDSLSETDDAAIDETDDDALEETDRKSGREGTAEDSESSDISDAVSVGPENDIADGESAFDENSDGASENIKETKKSAAGTETIEIEKKTKSPAIKAKNSRGAKAVVIKEVAGEKDADSSKIIFHTEEVTVIADKDAFKTEVTMTVKPVTDPDQLLKMVTALKDEGGSYTVKAYTVSFYDKDKNEVEPDIPVQVTVNTGVDAPGKSKVVHVKDDDKTEVLKAKIEKSGASFELDSFSDIGVATEDKTLIPGSSFDIYLEEELATEFKVGDLPAGPILAEDLPQIEGYEYENATIDGVQVEEIGTITDADGNVYVYYTTKDENGEIRAEILGDGRIRINLAETEQDTSYDLDADGMHVHIDAPAGAFKRGTYMEIQPVELSDAQREQVKEQAAEKFGEDAELRFQAVDITFYDKDGETVQPDRSVSVTLTTAETVEGDFCVIHLGNDDSADRMEAARSDDGGICFEASRFSIYIVVDDETTLPESRAIVNFYRADPNAEPITLYVKNTDTADELVNILYDPGVGALAADELFKGWCISEVNTESGKNYTADTEAQTIEDIREFFEGVTITEGDTYNIYPMIFKAYSIQFKDEDNITIHSDIMVNKTGEPVNYVINTPYTPKDQDKEFQGWNVAQGSDKIAAVDGSNPPYENETEVILSGNVVLTVNAPRGFWLSFQENGSGASYTPPQFIQTTGSTVTEEPTPPTRLGYIFGGWYENPECTGQPFTFGSKIGRRTTLYAKWTPVTQADYTVIIWHESMTDTYEGNVTSGSRHYDFVKSYTFRGNVDSTINAVSSATGTGNRVTDADGEYQNTRVQGTTPGGQTVNEVYSETGYHAAGFDTGKTIAAEGTTVVNVYYDRNAVTYTFHTLGGTSWVLCEEDSNSAYNDYIYTRNANGTYSRYSGTPRYGDGNTYYRQVSGCGSTDYQELVWKQGTSGNWGEYQFSKGLYGESLNWPTDTAIWWYPNLSGNTPSGTRMTYKDAFLPMDADMTVDYWGRRTTGNGSVHFWTQDVGSGNSYTEQYNVSTSIPSSFNINDKFSGFYAYQYRVDNGSWQNVGELNTSTGVYGDSVGYNSRLDIRYNRVRNKITFMDGGYFDGNGNELEEEKHPDAFNQSPEYYFQADVSAYNEDGNLYYVPPAYHNGYTFSGWYADDACTQPYNFTTMPSTGITVYAKWVQTQYRVFLHPNVPQSDSSLEWAQTNQEMNFRVTYGDKIAGGSMINGERSDYELIGWYTDAACKRAFNFDAFVLNDTTVTGQYNKSTDMTDPMDKYGIIGSNPSNSDLNRPWITKKIDLYAKWRSKLEGARGIDVVYDANGGTNAPDDPLQYLDSAEAIAQAASTPPDPVNQLFLHWVVQKWNGTAYEDTSTIVYPGASFDVLKANARRTDNPESTGDDDRYIYTVKLRAEYGPNEAPTPTHIWWFKNDVAEGTMHAAMVADNDLKINEAVPIEDPPTRDGYTFLGWARVNAVTESQSSLPEGAAMPQGKGLNLGADKLFLKYENRAYKGLVDGVWQTVEFVAADEKQNYHDLYAVWAPAIKVSKTVTGNMGDRDKSFTFTASLTGQGEAVFGEQPQNSTVTISADGKTATFSLKDGESVTIAGVPPQAAMTIKETGADGYETSAEGITDGSFDKNNREYSFTVPETPGEVTFTNDKDVVVDTRLKLDFLPYVLILGTVAAGVVLILRRRKEV